MANRNTIEIEDEYDVQDLFHALLKLYFDDIRPEEYTPSYGGSASRVDFLLKDEQIIIEIKKDSK
jgi:DNA-binding sugar fermentation-stimulating protein